VLEALSRALGPGIANALDLVKTAHSCHLLSPVGSGFARV